MREHSEINFKNIKLKRYYCISARVNLSTKFLKIPRFLHDSAALEGWVSRAGERIHRWTQLSDSEDVDVEQRRDHFLQVVVSMSWSHPLKITNSAGKVMV